LKHEVALLKRMLFRAVTKKKIPANPLAGLSLPKLKNIRNSVITEEQFRRLLDVADPRLVPILLVAFDGGVRKNEVLHLRREWWDAEAGVIRVPPDETKEEGHHTIYLTTRTREALATVPALPDCPYLFPNPATKRPWVNIRNWWMKAKEDAGIPATVWFHDQRRSFVTHARRRGIPESVVMKMTGHKTRAVFDRYNIVDENDIREAAQVYEAGAAREFAERVARACPPQSAEETHASTEAAHAGLVLDSVNAEPLGGTPAHPKTPRQNKEKSRARTGSNRQPPASKADALSS